MQIFKLFGSIFVDNDKANKSLSKTDKKAEGVAGKFLKVVKSAGKVGLAVAGMATVAGATIYKLASKSAETTDRIDKLSQRLGLSRKGFQEWEYALSQSGVNIDSLQSGMKTLSQRMGDAIEGTGAGAEIFNKLGVSVRDANGEIKSQEQVFNEAISSFQKMSDGIEKADLAQQLFARSGQELLPLLNSSSEATELLKQQANEMGMVLSDDAVDAGVKLTDTLDTMKRSIGAVFTKIGVALMPMIQSFSEWVITNMPQIQAVFSTAFTIIGGFVSGFIEGIRLIINWLKDWVAENQETINYIVEKFNSLFNTVREYITAFIDFAKEFWTKYGEDIKTVLSSAFEVVKSIFSTAFDVITDIFNIFRDLFNGDWEGFWEGVKKLFSDIWNGLKDIAGKALDLVIDVIKGFVPMMLDAGKALLKGLWEGIKSVWSGIYNWITDKLNWLKDKLMFWKSSKSKMSSSSVPSTSYTPSNIPGLATGGNIVSSGRVLVGEKGPEILDLKAGARVTPLNKMGGVTVNINNPKLFNDRDADKLGDLFVNRLRTLGVVTA
ncbi:phage tail tape measure protein [Clostridium sp. 'deep sea']|uniref:phage tail tape measure protein n=1 Tax=Clostridium sp. 'deep sea' TaxID=2779445 RepID=UPI00189647D2|nr:phage tail tape measure protein [Clostridium sp. 'deep sea']QOR34445.1 phage tail tape measure protein [Clostridium sp. 'deep sea']